MTLLINVWCSRGWSIRGTRHSELPPNLVGQVAEYKHACDGSSECHARDGRAVTCANLVSINAFEDYRNKRVSHMQESLAGLGHVRVFTIEIVSVPMRA